MSLNERLYLGGIDATGIIVNFLKDNWEIKGSEIPVGREGKHLLTSFWVNLYFVNCILSLMEIVGNFPGSYYIMFWFGRLNQRILIDETLLKEKLNFTLIKFEYANVWCFILCTCIYLSTLSVIDLIVVHSSTVSQIDARFAQVIVVTICAVYDIN